MTFGTPDPQLEPGSVERASDTPEDLFKEGSSAAASAEWLGSSLALTIGLLILGLAVWDEPFHIDELRQIGYYTRDLAGIVDGAFSQTQPPLDYVVGSWVQQVLGPRPLAWRIHGLVFAWGGLLLMANLLWKSRVPAFAAVALTALTPVFFSYSSYARPYALPFFLMILLLWSFEKWRTTRRVPYLIVGGAAAIALPLSRTTEPPVLLFLTLLSLITLRLLQGKDLGRWSLEPMGVVGGGLVASLVVLSRIQTAEYRPEGGINGIAQAWSRFWSDIFAAHLDYAPLAQFGFVLGFAGIGVALWRVFRRREFDLWWAMPLCLTAFAIPAAFAVLALPDQTYFDRYAYFAAPALGLGTAVLLGCLPSRAWINIVGIVMLFVASVPAVRELAVEDRPDYSKAADVASDLANQGNFVLYEQDSSIAHYRPGVFPGVPLFVSWSLAPISTELIARGDEAPVPSQRPVILFKDLRRGVPGWTRIRIDDRFDILVPDDKASGWRASDQATALWEACQDLPAETASYLCVTATRIALEAGQTERAQAYADLTLRRIDNEVVRSRVEDYLRGLSPRLFA